MGYFFPENGLFLPGKWVIFFRKMGYYFPENGSFLPGKMGNFFPENGSFDLENASHSINQGNQLVLLGLNA